jgi:ATP-binding cassette subfamily B protein
MKQRTCIRQHDITDCGAACLASVTAFYGLQVPISRIRQYASTDSSGTNLLGMAEAAEKLGLEAKAVRGTPESLPHIPVPAIAHLNLQGGLRHFVVLYRVTPSRVTVMDPQHGKCCRMTRDEFIKTWSGVLILLAPAPNFTKGNLRTSILSRFLRLIKPHRHILIQATAGALLYSLLGLSTSVYVQKIIDMVLVDNNIGLLRMMSLAMIGILLARLFIGIYKNLFMLKTGQKIDASLIMGYFRHLMKLPQQFFDTMRTGELISRVNDAVKIRLFINDISFNLLLNCLSLVLTLSIITLISWKAALLAGLMLPAYGLFYIILNNRNRKYLRKVMEQTADLESHFVESIGQQKTIKQLNLQSSANERTESRFLRILDSIYHAGRTVVFSEQMTMLFSGMFTVILFMAGSDMVMSRDLTPGELISLYTLTGYMIQPLNQMLSANRNIQDALIAADRLFQIIDLDEEDSSQPLLSLSGGITGDIQFQKVTFRYGTRDFLFRDFDCMIPYRTFTSICGKSGSGKSTLINLILRLYPINSGKILIGNQNICMVSHESLRSLIACVPQNTELISGTLLENITKFRYPTDEKRFFRISDQLSLNEIFDTLPEGYNTIVGERGITLSGGERQKIALARALYQDPEFLFLDESTASMDPVSEKKALEAIKNFQRSGKTVVLISHHLKNLNLAEHHIILDKFNAEPGNFKDEMSKAAGAVDGLT